MEVRRKEVNSSMRVLISATTVFLTTLLTSIYLFLPKIYALPRGQKAGMYSNLWLLGTIAVAVILSSLIIRKDKKTN